MVRRYDLWVDSPVGPLGIQWTAKGALRRIDFLDAPPAVDGPVPPSAARLVRQLEEYFAGKRTDFDLPLELEGTPFQCEVWEALRHIPYGRTISYGELARRLGRPSAMRAVGAANGRNPVPVVVPCHRVVGADGSLTGFGGGLHRKRILLELEAALGERERWTAPSSPRCTDERSGSCSATRR